MKTLKLLSLLALTACGTDPNGCDYDKGCTAYKEKLKNPVTEAVSTDFLLKGSVNSAFSVTVNGTEYSDMEEYYTNEMNELQGKIEKAGYEGYNIKFDAKLGFNDLTRGMTVYVSSKEKRGYQSKTTIDNNDTFSVKLPKEAAGDTYQIKANKRISIILTKGTEIKKFCYNFSAVDMEVPYTLSDKPIILSVFKSFLTAYECQKDNEIESLKIPTNTTIAVPVNN